VYNRADSCCDQRINQATLYVDDTQCGQIQFGEGTTKYSFDCKGVEGSKVTLKHSGQYINICEMEVLVLEEDLPKKIPEVHNVAVGRPAAQSSTGWGGVASRAVDGDINSVWGGKSCTHSAKNKNNFWSVELDQEEYVRAVVIYNRLDCCSDRIDGAKVWIGSGDDWTECGTINSNGAAVISTPCNAQGDKIKVTNNNNYLTLCEVQVITYEEENPSEEMDEE